MSSLVPLNNPFATSTVDFNNQVPTNASALFRYKINYYNLSTVFDSNDLNAVCIFTGGDSQAFLSDYNFSATPAVNAEIVFYAETGNLRIVTAGSANLYYQYGPYTGGPFVAGKITHIGSHNWFFSSFNATPLMHTWTNCCGLVESIYQITTSNTFDYTRRFYADLGLTTPYNGQTYDETSNAYYIIKDGNVTSSAAGNSCYTNDYSTAYTFYTGPDPDTNAVTLYSVAGLTPDSYNTLIGNKFLYSNYGNQYSCYTTGVVSPGDVTYYYGSVAQYPAHAIGIKDGYVISIS